MSFDFNKYYKGTELESIINKYDCIPPILYHYTNTKALLNIIENNQLWVTKSDFLNDKSEINYFWDLFNEIKKEYNNDFIKRYNERRDNMPDFFDEYYILSLSTNNDSLPLWANYSNMDGYNLGLDIKKLKNLNNNSKGNLRKHQIYKVIYDKKTQSDIISKEIELNSKIYEKLNEKEKSDLVSIFWLRLDDYSLQFKNALFSSEEEVRIIFKIDSKSKLINYREKDTSIVPFIKLNLNKIPIECITIGPKNRSDISKNGLVHYMRKKNKTYINIIESGIQLR